MSIRLESRRSSKTGVVSGLEGPEGSEAGGEEEGSPLEDQQHLGRSGHSVVVATVLW